MIKTRQILPLSERTKGLWRKILLAVEQSADISIINLSIPSPEAETPSALARQGDGRDQVHSGGGVGDLGPLNGRKTGLLAVAWPACRLGPCLSLTH